jgi:hypothetical protein
MSAATALVILDRNGRPIGRAIPRKERGLGFAATFMVNGKLEVRTYGSQELELKKTNLGWSLQSSFLTVTSVTFKDGSVSVVLMHNLNPSWNQIVSVPFGEEWKKAVTSELIRLNRETGSETHISNYSSLVV